MLSDSDVKDLIKELEKEMSTCREEDQFGYAKHHAYDVYKKVIERLKKLDRNNYHDVEKYYKDWKYDSNRNAKYNLWPSH